MTLCRVRTEDGEEVVSIDELEERLRIGDIPASAWIDVQGLTTGFVRLRDSPFAARFDAISRARFRAAFALDRPPWLALLLAGICIALHLWAESRTGRTPDRDLLVALGARARSSVLWDGEAWRLWTGALLHRDRLHLAFNVGVFIAVGGALESIYTRTGFLALVLWGALCSSLLSLWVGPQVTVGLSGVVFAALGACVGFGARFRDVLRRPYQHWFGVAALGYALFALWTSAKTPEVDHAGHLGGLLAGVVLGLLLPPRRWKEQGALRRTDPGALIAAIAAGAAIHVMFVLHSARPVQMVVHRADGAGVRMHVPRGFTLTRDAFGLTAYDNGLDAQVALGCARAEAAWPRWHNDRGPAEAIAVQELAREASQRDVNDLKWHSPRWTVVGENAVSRAWPAQELSLGYRVGGQEVQARLIAFERGLTRCALMLATRARVSPRRAPLLDRVRAELELTDPEGLVRAHAAALGDAANAAVHIDEGLAALQIGQTARSRIALEHALELLPPDSLLAAKAHYALAQLGLLALDVPLALEHGRRARALVPHDSDAAVAYFGALRHAGLSHTPRARGLYDVLLRARPDVLER